MSSDGEPTVEEIKAAVIEMAVAGTLQAHPFANMFPMLSAEESAAMSASIARDGLLEPIVIYQMQILDGRNRYQCLAAAGVMLQAEHLNVIEGTEQEARQYVESKNVHRRHLTVSQRAMLAAQFANLEPGEYRTNKTTTGAYVTHDPRVKPDGVTQAEAARRYDVSDRMIQHARRVRAKATPEIARMVEDGQVSVETARLIADRVKPAKQRKLVTPEQIELKAKAIRQERPMSYQKVGTIHLPPRLVGILAEMSLRPIEDLAEHQATIDKAVQMLHVLAAKVAEHNRKPQKKASAA